MFVSKQLHVVVVVVAAVPVAELLLLLLLLLLSCCCCCSYLNLSSLWSPIVPHYTTGSTLPGRKKIKSRPMLAAVGTAAGERKSVHPIRT